MLPDRFGEADVVGRGGGPTVRLGRANGVDIGDVPEWFVIPSQPTLPAELPNYLAEGVPKQDDESLRALQVWTDDLLTYRHEVAPDEIDADADEEIEAVEGTIGGTVVERKVSCGKDNCKCQGGELHGPYKYVVRRQGDSLNWEYKGPVTE